MRRTDRLMDLIQILRDGTLHKAEDLANRTGVSLRTIYRDMETLAASGVPIEGERGIGYRVTAAITLPPLNMTMLEVEALHLGLLAVSRADDPDLAQAAQSLSQRLEGVLPEDRTRTPDGFNLAVYPFAEASKGFQHLPFIRQAIRTRQKIMARIGDKRQTLRPLQLDYWGRLWTCIAWSETAKKFVQLRLDQITEIRALPGLFVDEPGKSLEDYWDQHAAGDHSQSDRSDTNGRK